ncbi:MAG: penicillin acylase family protein, partial [Pseudomonadota bacterium]
MVLRFAFSVVLGLLTLAACGPAPQTAEPEEVKQGTDIIWDEYGVAHIYADDDLNGFYAYGWAQMHAHGNRILELYGRARGRAAEYWGEP